MIFKPGSWSLTEKFFAQPAEIVSYSCYFAFHFHFSGDYVQYRSFLSGQICLQSTGKQEATI